MSQKVIGKCSICGGSVVVLMAYFGDPPKTCRSCGAVSENDLPVIPMRRKKTIDFNTLETAKWIFNLEG